MVDIRDEQPADLDAIRRLNQDAFGQPQEGRIVDALRQNDAVTVSLVAVAGSAVIGHIMFSPVSIGSLAGAGLGPMAVAPTWQRRGIGSQLVERGLDRLRDGRCPFVVVIGHPAFYPRFGFRPAADFGLTCEWDVPADAFMVNVLSAAAAPHLAGRVTYRTEFSTVE
jgi:putative acetyltransferase